MDIVVRARSAPWPVGLAAGALMLPLALLAFVILYAALGLA